MRLKSLEIIGFKSFADRTILHFEEGVTGIVGPNGTGKSNIVDAIRWVMGEQSAKHLRGSAMEDVIFTGCATRQPLGMAQVFLTFDNSDGRAPAEYSHLSEIEVGRRLYRSGESEYLINKTPCRLKDVIDLFLDTGVGTRAYSVIEQGTVGQVVSSRPEDRRSLIEEAAGISKFKSRKEAALRRIESTKANLLRLTDILAELQRQINSLNRQAKKAERYQKVAVELREREMALSSFRYNEYKTALKKLEVEKDQRSQEETLASSELSKCETDIESLRLSAAGVERELESVQEEFYATNQSIKLSESEIKHKGEEANSLEERGISLGKELVALNERLAVLTERLNSANQQKVEADCELETLTETVNSLEEEVKNLRNSRDSLSLEVEDQKTSQLSSSTSLSEFKMKIENLDRLIVEVTAKIAKDQSEIDALDRRKSEVLNESGEYEKFISGVVERRSQISQETSAKREFLMKTREGLKSTEAKLKELASLQNLAKSKLESLEEMRKNLDGYREGVRSVLLKSKEATESLKGILGTVGDIVDAEPEYEVAASSVLGERLQFVVVESHNEGVEAVEYLKTAAKGRSSFIPLNLRATSAREEFPKGEGIIGPLTNYVRFSNDYKQVGTYLFGDVVVAKSLKAALRHWEKTDTKHTFVTLDGEVVNPSGVVTGGIGGESDGGFIAQRRKIKELKDEISIRAGELEAVEGETKKLSDSVKSLEEELERIERDSHELEIKLVGHEHELENRRGETNRLDRERDRLVVETAALLEERNQHDLKRSSSAMRCEYYEKEKEQLRESLDQNRKELEMLSQTLSEKEKILVDSKVAMAQAEGRQSSIAREIEQSLALKSETKLDLGRKEDDITTGRQRVVVLRREVEQRRESLSGFILKVEKLTLLQQELQERYNRATAEIRERELSIRGFRSRRDEVLKLSHDVDLRLTESREKIRYLVDGIRERYHIDLASVDISTLNTEIDPQAEEVVVAELKEKLDSMGPVNVDAIKEYEELSERHKFISKQNEDLTVSLETLKQAISKINRVSRERFKEAFENVNEQFQKVFPKLFEGGRARLVLTDEEDLLETGVEIVVQPPGKRLQSISLLSGGEKALTAIAFIFSIFLTKPSPFCLLDEVDAPLDDANVDRFNNMIRSMTPYSQFILITHNKRTMELADTLYGVTMQEPGASKMVSVRLNRDSIEPEDVSEAVA